MSCPVCQGLFGAHIFHHSSSSFTARFSSMSHLSSSEKCSVVFLTSGILDTGAVEEGALPSWAQRLGCGDFGGLFTELVGLQRCLRQLLGDRTLFLPLFISVTFLILLTRVTRWNPMLQGVQFCSKSFLISFLFAFFITVSVVILVARVLLVTLWYVCLLPGFGLLWGLTCD